MMSPRHTRFKRSLLTALGALALAFCPAIAPREASGGEATAPPEPPPAAQPAEPSPSPSSAKAAEKAGSSEAPESAEATSDAKKAPKKDAAARGKKKAEGKSKKDASSLKREKAKRDAKKAKARKAKERERDAKAHAGDAAHEPAHAPPSKEPALSKAAPSKAPEDHATNGRDGAEAKASAAKNDRKAAKAQKKKKTASRSNSSKRRKDKTSASDKEAPRPPCFGPPVAIDRSGLEGERLSLVMCDGAPIEEARDRLSLLARPWGVARPEIAPASSPRKAPRSAKSARPDPKEIDPVDVAPGVRRMDKGLVARLDKIARRFPDKSISIVSGYRPQSRGSLHQTARAIDLRVAGVANEDLVAFCKTLPDTGCGYYPNSSFVHVDVRAPGTGSVSWIDVSGPGEQPRYVTQWPPPEPEGSAAPPFVPPGVTQAPSDAPSKPPAPAPALLPLPNDSDDDDAPSAPLLEDPPH